MAVGNTNKDGSGTTFWLKLNGDGRLEMVGSVAHDAAVDTSFPLKIAGVFRATPPAVADGDIVELLMTAAGRAEIVATGPAAHDAAAAGNPVRMAGVFRTTPPAVGNGDLVDQLMTVAGRSEVVEKAWAPVLQTDVVVNDSDKTFTVTAAKIWKILSIHVQLITTATVTNRQMTIEIQDASTNILAVIKAGVDQAPSLTYEYSFAPGLPDLVAVRDTTFVMTPLPNGMIILPSYVVRIYDSAAVDAAADDMTMRMLVDERDL